MWAGALASVLVSPIVAVASTGLTRLIERSFARSSVGQTRRFRHRARPPRLRPASVDIAAAIAISGSVPLEYAEHESSYSRARNLLNALTLAPSSPKPAFPVDSCELVRPTEPAIAGSPILGGFRLKVRLRSGEHTRHLRRSILKLKPRRGYTRTIAVCEPAELARPSSQVQCYLIDSAKPFDECNEDGDGPYVMLPSADPLGTAHGNRWQSRRKDVPGDVIWLVSHDGTPPIDGDLERIQVSSSRWRRYALLALCPLLIIVATLVVAVYAVLAGWLANALGVGSGLLDGLTTLTTTIVLTVLPYALALTAIAGLWILASHLVSYIGFERRWGPSWNGSTTRCIKAADLMRNGIEL